MSWVLGRLLGLEIEGRTRLCGPAEKGRGLCAVMLIDMNPTFLRRPEEEDARDQQRHENLNSADPTPSLAVHPGAVNTDMQDQWEDAYPGITGIIAKNVTLAFGRDPEQGSYSALYALLSEDVVKNDWNGVYLSDPVSTSDTPSLSSLSIERLPPPS